MITAKKHLKWIFSAIVGLASLVAVPAFAQSVDLLAEYRFENNLLPLQTGSTLIPIATTDDGSGHCNTTSGFVMSPGSSILDSWFWTSICMESGSSSTQ